MGNSVIANELKEVADNINKSNQDNDNESKSENKPNKDSKQTNKKVDIDLYNAPFSEKVYYGLSEIHIRDKLSVSGYFRETAKNKYNMDIPSGIINYCIMFLYFIEETEFYIGNLHELKTTTARNKHKWTMFISSSKTKLIPPKTIKQVKYYLHPTFHPSECTKTEPPFYLSRIGWGTFHVEAKIIFKENYKPKECFASHGLSFSYHASITQVNLKQNIRVKDATNLWFSNDTHEFRKAKDYPIESIPK